VIACYVAYAAVGWFLSGLGSALPDLEEQLGERTSVYPLLPGIVLLVWGVWFVRRHRAAGPVTPHTSVIVAGSVGLGVAIVAMGITRWPWASAAGAVGAAFAAAALIRLLPGMLATQRPDDTERVMVRANAWSSLGGITAPLAIGATIAIGIGWLPGMAVPIALAALVVGITARPRTQTPSAIESVVASEGAVPPLARWWRQWVVLTLCIVVEFCFAYFAATFLHDEIGLSTAAAAAGAAAWGLGMAGGRFVMSVVPPPRSVLPSVAMIAVGFVLLWATDHGALAITGIGVAGLGASPLYPTRATALLARFPSSPDQGSARGSIASGTALVLAPAIMAGLRAVSDVRTAYLAVPVLLVVLVALARPIPPAVALPSQAPVPPVSPEPSLVPTSSPPSA
jgi:MFS family permease